MSDSDLKKLRAILKEEIKPLKEELELIKHKLKSVSSNQTVDSLRIEKIKDQVSIINEKMDNHTGSLIKIEATLEGYADMYKVNRDRSEEIEEKIEDLEKRLKATSQN